MSSALFCEGSWADFYIDGQPTGLKVCDGVLSAVTQDQLQTSSAIEWADVSQLTGETIVLFSLVFGFLVLKKMLSSR